MDWYLMPWRKYAEFNGRSRRKELWTFWLVNFVIGLTDYLPIPFWSFITGIYGLAALIPTLAVTVRRLHDTGRSGWWILIGLIPIVGTIILIVFLATDSQPGNNQYGPNPKDAAPAGYNYQVPPAGYQPPPAQSPPPAAGAFCRNCGAQLPPGAGFCQNCGAKT
jgi:uncharacterized membrane protein YhaH (DUF805 family)